MPVAAVADCLQVIEIVFRDLVFQKGVVIEADHLGRRAAHEMLEVFLVSQPVPLGLPVGIGGMQVDIAEQIGRDALHFPVDCAADFHHQRRRL